jgi:TonB family protein
MRMFNGLVVGIQLFVLLSALSAEERAHLNVNRVSGSAVDSKGIRHEARDYPGRHPQWLDDRVKLIAPTYPYRNRQLHHEGRGWFQLTLDLRTGYVSKVTIVKSTGFKALDESAVAAFLQWCWKPGKWKEIDMAVGASKTSGDFADPLAVCCGSLNALD